MIRVNAPSHLAFVIEFEAGGDRADERFVRDSMRAGLLDFSGLVDSYRHPRVCAFAIACAHPHPALSLVAAVHREGVREKPVLHVAVLSIHENLLIKYSATRYQLHGKIVNAMSVDQNPLARTRPNIQAAIAIAEINSFMPPSLDRD